MHVCYGLLGVIQFTEVLGDQAKSLEGLFPSRTMLNNHHSTTNCSRKGRKINWYIEVLSPISQAWITV